MRVGICFLSAILKMFSRNTCILSSRTPIGSLFKNFTLSWQSLINPIAYHFIRHAIVLTLVVSILSHVILFGLYERVVCAFLKHFLFLLISNILCVILLVLGSVRDHANFSWFA